MLTRSYGDVYGRFKDGTSIMLMPGEKARTPYPWPDDDQCPHCGSKGYFERNEAEGVAHCLACGTWCFREILVGHDRNLPFPYRPRKAAREAICPECNRSFRTESLHSDVRCPACRDKRRKRKAAEYRKNSKEAAQSGAVA